MTGKGNAKKIRPIYAVIFFLIIFGGCATKEAVKSVSDEEALRERVMAYWNHRIKQELDGTYRFESSFFRKTVTLTQYIQRYGNPLTTYKNFEILEVNITDSDRADVKMKVMASFKVPGSPPFAREMTLSEQWVRMEGVWYHVIGNKTHPGK